MKHVATIVCLMLAAIFFLALQVNAADAPTAAKPATTKPKAEVWKFTPDPKLPNVLIIGDSISIGYTLDVRAQLKGKANVYRPLSADEKQSENCNGSTNGIKRLDKWLQIAPKWDVIHFNFGLHDLKHVSTPGGDTISKTLTDPVQASPELYEKNLRSIVATLKGTNAKLIFGNTTPVPAGATGRTPEQPAIYNAIAAKVMKENDIQIDDLFGFITPNLARYQKPKDVHYTVEGYKVLAGQVSSEIAKILPAR